MYMKTYSTKVCNVYNSHIILSDVIMSQKIMSMKRSLKMVVNERRNDSMLLTVERQCRWVT